MEHQVAGWVHIALGVVELVLGVVIAVKGTRRIPIPDVNRWTRRHGVAIDNVTGPHVEHYLTRGRRIRTICFLVPFAVDIVLELVAGLYGVRSHEWAFEGWAGVMVGVAVFGYFGGAVVAELTWRPDRGRTGHPQTAIAVARDLSDYVPGWITPWQRAAAAATVVLIPVIPFTAGGQDLVWGVLAGLTAVVVTIVTELARRHVVERRQVVMAPEWLAVDDAVRSTSAHILSGVGVLLVMHELSGQLGRLFPAEVDGPSQAVGIRGVGARPGHVGRRHRLLAPAHAAGLVAGPPLPGPGMILRVDPDSPVPPYEQLRGQLATMIATGVLPQGTRLPSIRQLVTDLGLAANTIGRAYHELELGGLIQTRGRHGTFVLAAPPAPAPAEREQRLATAAEQFAIQARQLGVDAAEAIGVLRRAFEALAS